MRLIDDESAISISRFLFRTASLSSAVRFLVHSNKWSLNGVRTIILPGSTEVFKYLRAMDVSKYFTTDRLVPKPIAGVQVCSDASLLNLYLKEGEVFPAVRTFVRGLNGSSGFANTRSDSQRLDLPLPFVPKIMVSLSLNTVRRFGPRSLKFENPERFCNQSVEGTLAETMFDHIGRTPM